MEYIRVKLKPGTQKLSELKTVIKQPLFSVKHAEISVKGGILFIFLPSVFSKVSLMALGYAVRCDAYVPENITTHVRVYKALPHWYMSVTGSPDRLVNVNSFRT